LHASVWLLLLLLLLLAVVVLASLQPVERWGQAERSCLERKRSLGAVGGQRQMDEQV
jgi:hypothetical protein